MYLSYSKQLDNSHVTRLLVLVKSNQTLAKGSLPKKKIADFETLSQLALPSPPLSPIETFLIETFLVLFDPSPRSLQLRHNFFF